MTRPATSSHVTTVVRLHQALVRVTIHTVACGPPRLVVSPGTRVVWTTTDSAPQPVTGDTGGWTSATLDTGTQFARVFSTTRTFPYYWKMHPTLRATVSVSGMNGQGGSMGNGSAMGAMGPMSTRPITPWTGYDDGHTVLYRATDTVNKAEAVRAHHDGRGLGL